MGWEGFNGMTKEDLINHLLEAANGGLTMAPQGRGWTELVAQRFTANAMGEGNDRSHLWTVWRDVASDGQAGKPWITLYVIKRAESDPNMWMYKEISETEQPSAIDCPLNFFELVPVAHDENFHLVTEWRSLVNAYWMGFVAGSGFLEDIEGE